jgi:hypothetical protein
MYDVEKGPITFLCKVVPDKVNFDQSKHKTSDFFWLALSFGPFSSGGRERTLLNQCFLFACFAFLSGGPEISSTLSQQMKAGEMRMRVLVCRDVHRTCVYLRREGKDTIDCPLERMSWRNKPGTS